MAKMTDVFRLNEISARPAKPGFSPEKLEAAITRLERACDAVEAGVGQGSSDPDTVNVVKTAGALKRLISQPGSSMEMLYRKTEAYYNVLLKALNNLFMRQRQGGMRGEPLEAPAVNEFSKACYDFLQMVSLGAQQQDGWDGDKVGFPPKR